jgi:hypothetical protein
MATVAIDLTFTTDRRAADEAQAPREELDFGDAVEVRASPVTNTVQPLHAFADVLPIRVQHALSDSGTI